MTRKQPAEVTSEPNGSRAQRSRQDQARKATSSAATSQTTDAVSSRPSALQHTPSWEHKLAFTLPEVMDIASVSNGYLYKAIGEGRLRAVKRGKRTLILRADLDAWLNSFPAIQPKQPAA